LEFVVHLYQTQAAVYKFSLNMHTLPMGFIHQHSISAGFLQEPPPWSDIVGSMAEWKSLQKSPSFKVVEPQYLVKE